MLGLIVIINKRIELIEHTFKINTFDEAKEELIKCIALEFNKLDIDFPLELVDFECEWFDRNYMIANAFSYNIFDSNENKWEKPWELDEIYSAVLEKIQLLEIDKPQINYDNDEDYNKYEDNIE